MKQAVVDRGARLTGRYDDPASSAGSVPTPDSLHLEAVEGSGRAVLVERADASCVLYRGGPIGEWPSLGRAWAAVRAIHPDLEWRRSTPGVWIGAPGPNSSEPEAAPAHQGGVEVRGEPGLADGSFSVAQMIRDDRRAIRA